MKPKAAGPVVDASEEISALIETLAETERRLEELTGGEVDSVAGRDGRTFLLHRAQEDFRHRGAARQAAILHELRVLFDMVPAMIWFKDTKNSHVRVNRCAAEAAGMSVAEMEGKSAYEIYPEQADAYYRDDLEVIASGVAKTGIVEKLSGKNGEEVWVQTDKVPVCNLDGKVTGLVVMAHDISAQKRNEEALRLGEERLRAALSASGTGTYRWDIRTNELEWDDSLDALFGLPGGETVRSLETFVAAVHPDDRAGVIERCERCARDGTDFAMEFRVVWPDGSLHWLDDRGKTFLDADDRPLHMTGACVDITARKRAAHALQQSQKQLRDILDGMGPSMFAGLLTVDGVMIEVNQAPLTAAGLKPEDVLGKPFVETPWWVGSPAVQQQLRGAIARAAAGEPSRFDVQMHGAGGEMIDADLSLQPLRDETGKVVFLIHSASVITERKRAEQALRENEERFRGMFTAAATGIAISTPQGRFLQANAAFCRMLGYTEAELQERDFAALTHPDDLALSLKLRGEVLTGERTSFVIEKRYLKKAGDIVWARHSVSAVRSADGEVATFIVVAEDITVRRRAEARMRRLVDSNAQGVIFWNPKGEITDGNDAFLNITGYTRADLEAGRINWMKMTPPEYAHRDRAALEELAATGTCPSYEKEYLRKDGSRVPILLGAAMFEDNPGEGVCFIVDITDSRRATADLRESQQRLTLATESARVGIWEWDVLTNDLVWDAQMYALYGIQERDFGGAFHAWQKGLHPEDRERYEAEIFAAAQGGEGFHTEFRVVWPNGQTRNIEAHGTMHRTADGSVARMIGVNWDITARKQAEDKVGEQANLLNLAHDAIMVCDMDDRIQFWNHGAEHLYGWTADEACGQRDSGFLSIERPAEALAAQRILLADGVWSGECRQRTKKGETVNIRSRWTLVRDEQGEPKSKLIINTDVTEQKVIEEQFLRAQRLESIGTLASGLAHDLNNILVPIMMAAPILRGEIDSVDREKFLDIVEASAQRGAGIIKQVLTFARGADGDRILLQPIDLLEEVSEIAQQTFPKSIVVRTEHEQDIRAMEGDSTQLHQVLLNLAINARDSMPEGGELRLRVKDFDVDEHFANMNPGATVGPHVILEVADTGCGISKEDLEKIYDPFFTTKGIGKGTGLGLSTVAGIVKSHGGFLQVQSKPGCTVFKVFLPAKESVDVSGDLATALPLPRGHGETVLMIDDEPGILEVAQVILTRQGYKVIVAQDGRTAIAIFNRHPGAINVVVTDLAMPGMGGLALARALRQIEPGIKIILSTGGIDDSNTPEIGALNANGFLIKPYTGRDLLLKIEEVLLPPLPVAA